MSVFSSACDDKVVTMRRSHCLLIISTRNYYNRSGRLMSCTVIYSNYSVYSHMKKHKPVIVLITGNIRLRYVNIIIQIRMRLIC